MLTFELCGYKPHNSNVAIFTNSLIINVNAKSYLCELNNIDYNKLNTFLLYSTN
jgi:hypothetical protein